MFKNESLLCKMNAFFHYSFAYRLTDSFLCVYVHIKTFLFQSIQFSQTVLFHTIQFSMSMQLVLFNPIRCYHSRPEWTWEQWQWRCAPDSPEPQHHWNITLRLFSIISRTLIGGGLIPMQRCSQCILLQHRPTGQATLWVTGLT